MAAGKTPPQFTIYVAVSGICSCRTVTGQMMHLIDSEAAEIGNL